MTAKTAIKPETEYTKWDRFGPLEREAHKGNQTRFKCAVVDNHMGGFIYHDALRRGTQIPGTRFEGEPEPTVDVRLQDYDRQAWKLEVRSQELLAILAERKLIDHYRKTGVREPIKAAIQDMSSLTDEKPKDWGHQAMVLVNDIKNDHETKRIMDARDYRFGSQNEQTKQIAESIARAVSETVLTGFKETMADLLKELLPNKNKKG